MSTADELQFYIWSFLFASIFLVLFTFLRLVRNDFEEILMPFSVVSKLGLIGLVTILVVSSKYVDQFTNYLLDKFCIFIGLTLFMISVFLYLALCWKVISIYESAIKRLIQKIIG